MEAAAEPKVVPAPAAAAPVPGKTAHTEDAPRIAIDRAPEKDVLILPLVRDQVRVLQIELEQIGVEDRLALELLTKLGADNRTDVLLLLVEVQRDLARIELELATLGVLRDSPAFGHEGIGVEIDDMNVDVVLLAHYTLVLGLNLFLPLHYARSKK